MENPEIFINNKEEQMDAGFSEKRAARIVEGKQQDNSQVKKRKPLILPKTKVNPRVARGVVSNREKLLSAYSKNSLDLHALLESLQAISQGVSRQSEQLITEIREKQKLQEELMHAIILDSKNELQIETLSKSLQDLVK